jgi:ATP-dependent helicase/nuclease subunit B
MAFWWPRFEKIARWFIETETERRPTLEESRTELEGTASIAEVKPAFTLKARADRIDRLNDGELVLIDYKTGAAPGHKEVLLGLSPQLSLEAVIALESGFKDLAYGKVARLEYWRLSGGAVPGEIKEVRQPGRGGGPVDANDLAEKARQGLVDLLRSFGKPDAVYPPSPRAEYAPRYNDYEHLARIAEWTVNQTDEEAGEFG